MSDDTGAPGSPTPDDKHCESCEQATTTLTEAECSELAVDIDTDWERTANQRLYRYFQFRNFRESFAFATKVALLAEAEGHHPNFAIGYGWVELTLVTHSVGGLTVNDFTMAGMIDRLL